MKNTAIKLFEEKQVRSIWNEAEENGIFLLLMSYKYLPTVIDHANIGVI